MRRWSQESYWFITELITDIIVIKQKEEEKMRTRVKVVIALSIVILMVTSGFGQADIGFKGIGGKLGLVDPGEGVGSTIAFGAVVNLGSITPKIMLQADVAYWGKDYDVFASNDFTVSSFSISAIGKYMFAESDQQLRPFAGAGLGFNFNSVSWEYDTISPVPPYQPIHEKDSDSDTDIGIHIVGGTHYMLSDNLDGFAEFRYMIGGDWDYWGIFAGVVFLLGK